MYFLFAPKEKFGILPAKTPLMTDEVLFSNNVAFCPKFFWKKHHILQGCLDITPRFIRKKRKDRVLNRILFILTGGIGDAIWGLPVVRYMRKLYPKAIILIATEERNQPAFLHFPYADFCVSSEFWNLQNLIRTSDEVYDFGGIATLLKKEMGMDPLEACFVHAELPVPKDKKEIVPHLVVALDEAKKAEALLKRNGVDFSKDRIVSLALEASTPNRNWPFTYVLNLSFNLMKEGYKVVWLAETKDYGNTYFFSCECGWDFTSVMIDTPLSLGFTCPKCNQLTTVTEIKPPADVINLSGKISLREVMSVISLSDVVVGPNSALWLIAASLGIPTVGLFGAFDPKIRAKYFEKFIPMYKPLHCSPCNEHWTECRLGYPAPCMKNISPLDVYEAIMTLLKKYPRQMLLKDPII